MSSRVPGYTAAQAKDALRLYRSLMKLQQRKVPDELRALGNIMIKQEFRLHLDSASADQMGKFIMGWGQYEQMLDK